MNADNWSRLLIDASARQGRNLDPELQQVLLDKITYAAPNDTAHASLYHIGIIPLLDRCSQPQKRCAETLAEVLRRDFFWRVENQQLFGEESRISRDVQAIISQHSATHAEFCSLWRTFESFREEVEDVFPSEHNLVAAQIVKSVLTEIQGVFFPTPGPYQIPIKERLAAQRAILQEYASGIDAETLVTTSPINTALKARQSRITPIVILAAAAITAVLVPRESWWGTIVFWTACVVTVLCVSALIPGFARWIMTGRFR